MVKSYNEFHISRAVRDKCQFDKVLYSSSGNVVIADIKAVRLFTIKFNKMLKDEGLEAKCVSAGSINAMGLIDEIFHYICMIYRRDKHIDAFKEVLSALDTKLKRERVDKMLLEFMQEFPPVEVYEGRTSAEDYLNRVCVDTGTGVERSNREQTLEELILLHLANENPAFSPFSKLFSDEKLQLNEDYAKSWAIIQESFKALPTFGPFKHDLIGMLREPVLFSPLSLKGQLDYIKRYWIDLLGDFLRRLLMGLDTLSEEEKASWGPTNGGDVEMDPYNYDNLMKEYERFSPDKDWMPCVILMAKTVLVWLDQLTKKYKYPITRLDQIPDAELDALRDEGFTGLWLIGLWERSNASKRIKQICGNPEAAASAYSLYDYNIASNIGGWDALSNLRARLWARGIRLASDMVPNHTGMDSKWVMERPDLFVQRRDPPSYSYDFSGENLSHDGRVGVYLDNHYYNHSDCAVVFKRVDNQTGDTRYIYHGNDGTGMPWNDTAQIDFLNPEAREAVMQDILHVARNFPIIRFDAAMVLAKKSIRRLWYPKPGSGGDIYSRSESALSDKEFEERIPNEFWREVVDRVAKEVPDTLLLAEAFWMMEGYFVRTLGMHRVYNSAFMNMLKKEENQKYRDSVKNTIKFDPQILKRYVNFMNNPDEDTAVAQFGKDDKYFGVCTLMITMPGLPMFGHGQIEGFTEKYGMEFTKAYRNETPDTNLVNRHWRDIFPLMKRRYLFANVENFLFYDVWDGNYVNENIFAYSNRAGKECSVVFYNNKYERAQGTIKQSCEYALKSGSGENETTTMVSKSIGEALGLTYADDMYLIFREHKSGLWYIRNSKQVFDNGLFTCLNGFEYQVYLDLKEVKDTGNKYRILCEKLGGKGCQDLEAAWEEICYSELYSALEPYASLIIKESLELIDSIRTAGLKDSYIKDKLKLLERAARPLAISFYTISNKFLGNANLPTPEAQYSDFMANLIKIIELESAKRPAKVTTLPGSKEEVIKKMVAAKDAESFTKLAFTAYDNLSLLLIQVAIVKEIAIKDCAIPWGIMRKMQEYTQRLNCYRCDVWGELLKLFYLSVFCNKERLTDKKSLLSNLSKLVASGEHAAVLFGANLFNKIVWFNEEKAQYCLALAISLLLLDNKDKEGDAEIMTLYHTLTKAEKEAGYKCQAFIDSFDADSLKKGAKKAGSKKEATNKTAKKAVKKSSKK